jgi:hypothetical protein
MTARRQRFAWAKLNADTLFLGLLAAGSGFFALLGPDRDSVTALHDSVYPLHYVRAGAYLLAGLVLVAALLAQSVRWEVIARSILIGGVLLNVYRHVSWLGFGDVSTQANVVLLVILALTSYLRLSVLLGRGGLLVARSATCDDEVSR